MNAAAPEGTPPRRINDGNLLKPPCPAVPQRGPEAGGYHNIMDFHTSGVNPRSWAFQQSHNSYFFYDNRKTSVNCCVLTERKMGKIPFFYFKSANPIVPSATQKDNRCKISMKSHDYILAKQKRENC